MTGTPDKYDELFKDLDPEKIKEAVERAREQNKARIDSIDVREHIRDAFEYLDDNFAYWLTDVLNMGYPIFDSRIDIAAVYLPKDSNKLEDFKFIINPTFAALLEPEELAFILSHETMHILLNHLRVLPHMVKRGAKQKKSNISADLLINNYLRNQGLDVSERLRKTIFFGEDWTGYDTCYSTVRQIYRDIDDDKLQEQQDLNDALGQYLRDLRVPATGGHGWIYEQEGSQGTAEKIAEGAPQGIQDKKDDEDNKPKQNASTGVGSEAEKMRRWIENNDVSMDWAKLLSQVDPDIFKLYGPAPYATFARAPRKLAYVYEKYPHLGRLPSVELSDPKKGDLPAIVMYLDGSGSCSDYIDKFVRLAKSVPEDKIKIIPRSFSTYVQPLDLHDPKVAQGGTEFSIIEDDVLNTVIPLLGHYPKAIVVLTDGIGYFSSTRPKTHNEHKWLWMLKGTRAISPRPGKDVDIDQFTKGMVI